MPEQVINPSTAGNLIHHQWEWLLEENRQLKDLLRQAEWSGVRQTCFCCGGEFLKHRADCQVKLLLRTP